MKTSVLWTEKGHYFSCLIEAPIILLIVRKNIPEHVSEYPHKNRLPQGSSSIELHFHFETFFMRS